MKQSLTNRCQRCGTWFSICDFSSRKDPYCPSCAEESFDGPHWRELEDFADTVTVRIADEWDIRRYLTEKQRSRCAICGKSGERLVLDHNHQTGFVRGMLCASCNSGLGMFRDSPAALRKAVDYLHVDIRHPSGILYQKHPTKRVSRRRLRGA